MNDPSSLFRRIPKIDRVLLDPDVEALVRQYGRGLVVETVREVTEGLRARAREGVTLPENGDLLAAVRAEVTTRIADAARPTLRRAINATGVVLHTGLGRAVLSRSATESIAGTARSHALLEVDPETGERGSRLTHVAPLLRELTGAEDALAVNNNAAAVFLAIGVLAAGREVVISRGQLVEIGGAFRIPDVIRSAGARLVEVGTTNRTRIRDYAEAIGPDTALVLRVHPSNFRIVGFTEEPPLEELVTLGRERGIPVLDDLGSGALVDLTRYGLVAEPTVQASVLAGADVITFSGDKLLGAPQAGLVVGRTELIQRMKRHPLMRVLRVDKLTLAGLEATLRLYRDEETAIREIPTLAALTVAPETLRLRAERMARRMADLPARITLEPGISQVGGGSLPGEELPTTLVCLAPEECGVTEVARRLRTGEPSVWGRIWKERLVFDLRTVRADEEDALVDALRLALGAGAERGE